MIKAKVYNTYTKEVYVTELFESKPSKEKLLRKYVNARDYDILVPEFIDVKFEEVD